MSEYCRHCKELSDYLATAQAKCAELERERDDSEKTNAYWQEHYRKELAALKAQGDLGNHGAGEHVHCENCGYPMYPTTEPVKAQAGEPYSDGMTAEDDKQFNRQWDVKPLTPQWDVDVDWLYSVLRYADKNPDSFPEVAEGKITLDGSDAQTIIDALNNHHPITEPVKAQAGEPVMPAYGQISWKDLVDAIGEAQGVPWKQDESYYIGHQPVSINMNSLNRIVSKFAHPTTERRVIPEDVRKVMEMALEVIGYAFDACRSTAAFETVRNADTALRNVLNAAPEPTKEK